MAQRKSWRFLNLRFESRVVLDGSQTAIFRGACPIAFESRVVLDGSQTARRWSPRRCRFESRVVLDGSQTMKYVGNK